MRRLISVVTSLAVLGALVSVGCWAIGLRYVRAVGAVQEPRARIAEPADAGALAAFFDEFRRDRTCPRAWLRQGRARCHERNGVAVGLYKSLGFSAQSAARL